MGWLSRWLLWVLEMALLPLVQQMERAISRTRDVEHAVEAWGAAVQEKLVVLDDHQTMRGAEAAAGAEELLFAVRGQTEALRAWEDALLGRVREDMAAAAAKVAAEVHRAATREHLRIVLSDLVTPDELATVERIVAAMAQDGRLKAQRPGLRGPLATQDIVLACPRLSFSVADAVRALVYLRHRGRLG